MEHRHYYINFAVKFHLGKIGYWISKLIIQERGLVPSLMETLDCIHSGGLISLILSKYPIQQHCNLQTLENKYFTHHCTFRCCICKMPVDLPPPQ